uniref:Rabphilin-3A Exophilin-1 n=1 Tax=Angiostrongylus cantonensis TaxID=6313 RepID=A0A158PCC4_ANGCA
LKSGWSVRTATARSPTNSKGNSAITEAEQEHIKQVLAKAEASRLKEQQRLGYMVDRLEKMRRRATGNGVTHCLLCRTEFGLLSSKSYAAMCVDCRKYVCQRNCGVETFDCNRGEVIFLCKICSEAREVLWKKSGAWFYKELPEFVRPEANGSVISPPLQHHRSSLSSLNGNQFLVGFSRVNFVYSDCRTKSPRPRIQPSWVKEKVMSSMSANDDDRSSSEGEFAASGVIRRNHKPTTTAPGNSNSGFATQLRFRILLISRYPCCSKRQYLEEESSPDSRASTRSTSPRRSLATPSSYDSTHNQTAPPTHPDDARSIDSGVVQSDHSNPQQAMTLSVSSLAPFSSPATVEMPPIRRISQAELSTMNVSKVTTSLSGWCHANSSFIYINLQTFLLWKLFFDQLPEHFFDCDLVLFCCRSHKNLKAMDSNGFSDPYVKLHLLPGNAKATKLTSKTIEKTLNPEWNEELNYYGVTEEDKQKKTLRITVLDRDRIGSDFLGETRVALRKLPMNVPKKYNLYLEHAIPVQQPHHDSEVIRGKILVALQYNIQQGSLFVTIKRCVELIGMDSTGFSDPYCKVSLTPITSKAHRQRTSTKKRTLNPEFNETLTFIVPFKDLPKKTLQIGVYDHDLGKHDDYIGGIVLSTSAKDARGKQWCDCIKNPGQTFEMWHQLQLED